MVYFDIKVFDEHIILNIIENRKIKDTVKVNCPSFFTNRRGVYNSVTEAIIKALGKIDLDSEYFIYVTYSHSYLMSGEEIEYWKKGLLSSFSQADNVIIETSGKSSIYLTNSKSKNRISFIFDKSIAGWLKNSVYDGPIYSKGMYLETNSISLSSLGRVIFNYLYESKSKKLTNLLLKEFSTNNRGDLLSIVYANFIESKNLVSNLAKRKFLKKVSEELTADQKKELIEIIKKEIDFFVSSFNMYYSNKIINGDISISLIGRVFFNFPTLTKYFKSELEKSFPKNQIFFTESYMTLDESAIFMLKELKW